jgi:phage terminase small subunit
MRKLTAKQQLFVKEYLVDLNATQAAIRAGYSKKTANRIGGQLLVKTCIANALQKAIEERNRRVEVNQDFVVAALVETVERCLNRIGNDDFSPSGANRALELLGKHLGMFVDRTEITTLPPERPDVIITLVSPDGSKRPLSPDGDQKRQMND